jgi:putative transposase
MLVGALLNYKANWNAKEIIKIDNFFPSSNQCSSCGWINQNLKLDIREWTCPSCNTELDRDFNASKNIPKEGIKILSSRTGDHRCGDEIRPVLTGKIVESSKKKELVSGNISVFN